MPPTFAPLGRPTGSVVAERTFQAMKIEHRRLEAVDGVEDIPRALGAGKRSFDEERPHPSLTGRTPREVRAATLAAPLWMAS